MLRRLLLTTACLLASAMAMPAFAADSHWMTKAEDVNQAITVAETAYSKGDIDSGKRALTEAYFRHYEDSKLETAVRAHISAKRAAEVEKQFALIRKAMTAKDSAQVANLSKALREAMITDAKSLDNDKVPPDVLEVNK